MLKEMLLKIFILRKKKKKTKRDSVDTPVFAKPLSSDSNSSSNNTYVSASRGLLTDEEKARLERENAGHGDLYAYQEEQMRQEREFRKNRDEDDKKKQDYISSLGAAGLAKYQESIEERERELKRKMAEGEKNREEEINKTSASLEAFKLRQVQEEKEFRQKREEEERRKRETLEAMATADRERRESAMAREKVEVDRAKQEAQAKAVKKELCYSCKSEVVADQIYRVKGLPFCFRCSIEAGADKCSECGQPISSGTVMKVGAKKYHAACLKCDKCSGPLTGGYRVRRNKMVCLPCSNAL